MGSTNMFQITLWLFCRLRKSSCKTYFHFMFHNSDLVCSFMRKKQKTKTLIIHLDPLDLIKHIQKGPSTLTWLPSSLASVCSYLKFTAQTSLFMSTVTWTLSQSGRAWDLSSTVRFICAPLTACHPFSEEIIRNYITKLIRMLTIPALSATTKTSHAFALVCKYDSVFMLVGQAFTIILYSNEGEKEMDVLTSSWNVSQDGCVSCAVSFQPFW